MIHLSNNTLKKINISVRVILTTFWVNKLVSKETGLPHRWGGETLKFNLASNKLTKLEMSVSLDIRLCWNLSFVISSWRRFCPYKLVWNHMISSHLAFQHGTSSVNCWEIAFLIKPITVDFSSPIYKRKLQVAAMSKFSDKNMHKELLMKNIFSYTCN